MVLGVAMGNANGVLIAGGAIVAREGKTGWVEMVAAQIEAFLGTDCKRQFLTQQGAAIDIGLLEGTVQFEAVEPLSLEAFTQQPSEGFGGKKLGR
jgi:hypothetical protein